MIFFSNEVVKAFFEKDLDVFLTLMRDCLIKYSRGSMAMVPRTFLRIPGTPNHLGSMIAHESGGEGGGKLGLKLVSLFPGQSPSVHSMIVLYDDHSGQPRALVESAFITTMRTAAVSAVAAACLFPPPAPADVSLDAQSGVVVAILGTGEQGYAHYRLFRRLYGAGARFRTFSRSGRGDAFLARCGRPAGLSAAASLDAALAGAHVIVCATSSGGTEPILHKVDDETARLIVSVGACLPHEREVADDLLRRSTVVVDSKSACAEEAGDIILSGVPMDGELGALLAAPGPPPPTDRLIFFKSVGLACEDVTCASYFMEKNI